MKIMSIIVVWTRPSAFLEIRKPIICRRWHIKMEVKRVAHKFGQEIFFPYHEINNFEIKFCVKKTLVACYSREVSA